jgi:hypothetical protein
MFHFFFPLALRWYRIIAPIAFLGFMPFALIVQSAIENSHAMGLSRAAMINPKLERKDVAGGRGNYICMVSYPARLTTGPPEKAYLTRGQVAIQRANCAPYVLTSPMNQGSSPFMRFGAGIEERP